MANIFSKSFWQPAAGKTRIRDVIRELPGAFGQTIVPGTIKFGQAIGGAIAAPSVAKQLAEAEAKQLETNQVIFQKMRQNKAEGKSNGNLINFLKNQNKMASSTLEEVVPAAKMTTGQIAGAALGTAVETLGFGTAFKSAKSMRAAALAASKGVGPASTAGIVKATGKELARNVPFGYGADVSRRLMEGETGAAALKPGLGTAFTAALPVFGGAERAFRLSRANDIAKLQRFGFTSDEARKVAPNLGLPDTPALNKIGAKMGKLADQINSSTDINFVQKGEAQLQNLKNQFKQTLGRELQAGKVQIGRGAEEAAVPKVPAVKETAGNIRLDKFAISDEGKNLLRKIIDENKGFLAQRRGVRTWQETQAIADQIIPKTRLKKGTALNAEELQSLGDTVTSLTNKADNLAQKILDGDNSDKTLLEFARAKTEMTFATASYAGATSEAGRSFNIIKKLNEALMSNDAKLIKQALKLTGDRDKIEDILSKLALMGDDDLAKIKFLRASSQATKLEMIQELWINSILAGPVTQMANALGNTTMALLRPVTRGVQAGVSKNVYLKEAPEMVVGAAGALQDGIRNALFVFRNGLSPEQVSKVELGRLPAIPGKFGKVIRTPSNLLNSVDEFIKTVVGAGEMRALAYRQARKEGLKGQDAMERMYEIIQTPSKEFLESVTRAQADATFQAPLGKIGNAVIGARDKIPGAQFVIPFIRTPINIAKEAIKMSPAGFGVAAYKKATGKYAGDMSAKASEDIAKAIIGSMMAIPVVIKASQGTLTGSAPKNKAEREAFYREGKQPYAIKVGNRWISYRRMEPFATIFGVLADMTQVKTEEGIQSAATQALGIIGRNFNDKTFMSGLSQAVEALTDPEQSEQFFLNMASGFLPYSAASRTIAQTIDPTVRRTESLKEKYMAQIPFLSQKLTPRRDLFGEEIKRTRSQVLSPLGITEERNDAVIKEMEALGVTPGAPGEKIFDLKLSQKEYDNYLKVSGRVTKKVLDTIVASPNWNNLSAREREKAVQDTIRKVREQTRDALFPLENKSGDISQYLRKQGYTKEESEQLAKKIITNIKERQTQQ